MLKKWKEYVSREAARYRQEEWLRYNRRRRERLKTADFTIIASRPCLKNKYCTNCGLVRK